MARPLADLTKVFDQMATAAPKANAVVVKKATEALGVVVRTQGSRFRIKGRRGDKVPLGASVNVKQFATPTGPANVGRVAGVPEGFWAIVERGSGPHIITGKRNGRKVSGRTAIKRYSEGTSFGDLRPLGNTGTGFGPYQFVHHPGHRQIGRPWETAMETGRAIVPQIIATEQTRALIRAFD